jgi:ABC-type uncharacterized transport system fused permease/ATPase subunit
LIGKPLVQLEFRRERYEADFRFSLARLREYSKQVALLRGENAERRILDGRSGSIVSNFYAIVGRTLRLLTFTTRYFQANVVIPYFFLGKTTLGQNDPDGRRLWPGRVRADLLYRALPVAGVLQGCRRTADDISLGH